MAAHHCILIVEDEADLRDTLADILLAEGYSVEKAANGRDALDYLQNAPPPCLILLDLMMPVMNGFQFRQQQQQDPALAAIPVAIVSAFANDSQRVAPLAAAAHLSKPLDVSALLDTVSHYC